MVMSFTYTGAFYMTQAIYNSHAPKPIHKLVPTNSHNAVLGMFTLDCAPSKYCIEPLAAVDVGPIGPNPDKIIPPNPPPMLVVASGIVLVPMNKSDAPSDTRVPAIVTAGPPGTIVIPATTKPVGFAVNVWPSIVKTALVEEGRAIVRVPMTRPEAPNEITVPEMVTAGRPGKIDVPAILKPVAFAVNV